MPAQYASADISKLSQSLMYQKVISDPILLSNHRVSLFLPTAKSDVSNLFFFSNQPNVHRSSSPANLHEKVRVIHKLQQLQVSSIKMYNMSDHPGLPEQADQDDQTAASYI